MALQESLKSSCNLYSASNSTSITNVAIIKLFDHLFLIQNIHS